MRLTYGAVFTKAYAGGFGLGVSPNPSVYGAAPVTSLKCYQQRVVNVMYSCSESYGFCYLWTRTYTAWITVYQPRTYTATITGNFAMTSGIEVPIPRVPFAVVKYYALIPAD